MALCPWRSLLRTSTCVACLSPAANFAVRSINFAVRYGAIVAKVCSACALRAAVQHHAASQRLEIDTMGMDGKALWSSRQCERESPRRR